MISLRAAAVPEAAKAMRALLRTAFNFQLPTQQDSSRAKCNPVPFSSPFRR